MSLPKLAKVGSLILAGSLIGGLATYKSKTPEIIKGIDDIKVTTINAKKELITLNETNVKLTKENDDLEVRNTGLVDAVKRAETDFRNSYNKLQNLGISNITLKSEIKELENQLNSKLDASSPVISKANEQINKANSDQVTILEKVNSAKAEIAEKNNKQ